MNTQGPIAVVCTLSLPGTLARLARALIGASFGEAGTPGTLGTLFSSEWVIGAGAAWGIRIFQSNRRSLVRRADGFVGP